MQRYCLWIKDSDLKLITTFPKILDRIEAVKNALASKKKATQNSAARAHRFDEVRQHGNEKYSILLPVVSSEFSYLPVSLYSKETIVYGSAFAIYTHPYGTWQYLLQACILSGLALYAESSNPNSLLEHPWWNISVPELTKNKDDLTRCAKEILLAREAHFPATIADSMTQKIYRKPARRA